VLQGNCQHWPEFNEEAFRKLEMTSPKRSSPRHPAPPAKLDVDSILADLKRLASPRVREEMETRYGIHTAKAFGVPVGKIQSVAKKAGKNHEFAAALWKTGWYEARMAAAYIDEPERVTAAQMDAWCRDFDNWGICDTVCFVLFDRTPHAWRKVKQWSNKKNEFEKRAAFALLWGLTVHDKQADDEPFLQSMALVRRAATDERHFVKKAVNMALRAVGKRNAALNSAARDLAKELAASPNPAARWIGMDALRELTGASVTRRLAAKTRAPSKRSKRN